MKAMSVIKNEQKKDPTIIPMLVLLTDGRSNISIVEGADPMSEIEKLGKMVQEEGIYSIVIDSEVTRNNKFVDFTFEFAKDIAEYMGAKYYRLDQLNAVSLGNLITMEKDVLRKGLQKVKKT